MNKLLSVLLCVLPVVAFSQSWKTIPVSTGGKTGNVFIYRPADTVSNGKPGVVVFWHGGGEAGTDTTKLYRHGPLYYIKNQGWRPNFYVVAVQTPSSPADYTYVRVFMNWLFRGASAPIKGADTTRIGMTGLSYGAYNTYVYVDNVGMTNGNGIVPHSAVVMSYEHNPNSVTESYWTATHKMWGFSDPADVHSNDDYFSHLTSTYPGTNKRFTSYTCSPPHGCWNDKYSPSYNDPIYGGSVYDFMDVEPMGNSLVAHAGNDQNVTLPTTVNLSGAGSVAEAGKTITAYQWTVISGPNTPTQSGANNVSNTLSGLMAGTYVIELMVTQSDSATAKDTVSIVVNPDPSTLPVINVSTAMVSGLTATAGTAGSVDSFTVSGNNLVTDISVGGTSKCEVSLSRTTGFGGTVTVTQSGGIAAATKVYVRIKASAPVGAVSEANNITSAPATAKSVSFNGNVSGVVDTITVAQFNFARSAAAGGVAGWVDCLGSPLDSVCSASDSRSGSAIGINTISTSNWINIPSTTTSSNIWGATVANPTFYFPSGVYPGGFGTEGLSYTPGQEQMQFTGLNPNARYRFEIIGSRTTEQASRRCVYFIIDSLGTTSDTLDVKNNTANIALFTGKVPTSNGIIKLAMKRDGSDAVNVWGAYLMAIRIIQEEIAGTPSISVSPSTISGLTATAGTAGSVDSFTVSGSNLVTDISVGGTSKCEVSLSRASGFGGTVTVTQSGGIAAATKVYVRIKASAPAGAVSESNNITSAPATAQSVLFNGNVYGAGSNITVAQFNFARSAAAGGVAGWVDCLGSPLDSVCSASDSRSGSAIGINTISTSNWINIPSTTTSSNIWGATVANPTFYFPSGVYPGGFGTEGLSYTPGQEQLQFTGLNPNARYRFEIIGSRTTEQASRRCVYFIVDSLGTTSDTLDVKNNTANIALFTGKVPTSNGIIKLAMKRDGSDAVNVWGAYLMAVRIIQEEVDEVPENIPPIASAGPDQVRAISLATVSGQTGFPSQALLDGSASTDPDGTIGYIWSKLSGPAGDTLYNPNSSQAVAARLKTAGVYVYQLTVMDNDGAISRDTISITTTTSPVIRRPTPGLIVKDMACNEYSVGYLASNDTLYMRQWDGASSVDAIYGLMGKPVSISGGQYDWPVVDDKGFAYWVPATNWPKVAQLIEKDRDGYLFNNVKSATGYLHQWMFLKADGSLWTWGNDNWNWYGGVAQTAARPLPMPAGGVSFKQVAVSEKAVICLATNGSVYQYMKNDTFPQLVSLPRPAIGIAASRNNFYCAIVPDAGQPDTSGRPFCWGKLLYMGGTNTTATTPVDMHDTWNIGQYIKQVTCNDNTLHALDVTGKVWGFGNNDQGEVGNGYDRTIHCEIVGEQFFYNWDWSPTPHVVVTAPANITPPGITVKKMYAGTVFAFYNYFIDSRDTVWSYGRGKSDVLGDGYSMGSSQSVYPNGLDEPSPSPKNVLYAPANTQTFIPMTTNAGADQNITGSSAVLNGAATPSTFRTIVSTRWRKHTGGTYTIGDSTALSTTLSDLQEGTYSFILRVTDDRGATREDTVLLQVTEESSALGGLITGSRRMQPGGDVPGISFTTFPNPFTSGIDIVFASAPREKFSIRVLDMTGRTLVRKDDAPHTQNRVHLDLSGYSLSAGVYLLEVRTGASKYITKIKKVGAQN